MNEIREIEEKLFDIDQGFKLGAESMYRDDEVAICPLRQKNSIT
jgi:hypothetical protein